MIIHVAKTGNDSNDGSTYALAKLTIQAAIDAAAAGNTIYIWNGTYSSEVIDIDVANLILEGVGWGTIISKDTVGTPTITISANGVTIKNLQVKHTGTSVASKDCVAIKCVVTNLYPVIDNCRIDSTDVGCWVEGDGYTIRNCIISGAEYGIYSVGASNNKYGYTIENCSVYLAGWTVCNAGGIYIVTGSRVIIRNVNVNVNVTTADSSHQAQGITLSGTVMSVLENIIIKVLTGNTTYETGLYLSGGGPALSYAAATNVVILVSATTNTYSIRVTTNCALALACCRYNTTLASGVITQGTSGLSAEILAQANAATPALSVAGVNAITAAWLALTGITAGGTLTMQKLLKMLSAWVAGNWRDKPGDATKQELLDADNGTTIILEQTIAAATPYRATTIKI